MSSNTKKPPQSDRTQGANIKTVSKNNTIKTAVQFPFFWNLVFCIRGGKFNSTESMDEPPPINVS